MFLCSDFYSQNVLRGDFFIANGVKLVLLLHRHIIPGVKTVAQFQISEQNNGMLKKEKKVADPKPGKSSVNKLGWKQNLIVLYRFEQTGHNLEWKISFGESEIER